MLLIIPGRHHLLTQFQFDYLSGLIQQGVTEEVKTIGTSPEKADKIEGVIFAVTSSNHSGTKRNPLPYYLRSIAIHEFGKSLQVPTYIYGINDVGRIDNFADHLIKSLDHHSNNRFDLRPQNALVVSSTPLHENFLNIGYTVLPAELADEKKYTYRQALPWDWVLKITKAEDWLSDQSILNAVHDSSLYVWNIYNLGANVREILNDPIIGEDGDLTETRNYDVYVRQMDEIAALKYQDTAPFIQGGNIGDIGCAVGSWIKQACQNEALHESDFYGIEVARQLFEICKQRKQNQEFDNPNVFFSMKNAVTGPVFKPGSMNTLHSGSLTHEIASYGSEQDLLRFIKNRYEELKPEGVWINRDVVGPEDGNREVLLWLDPDDGDNDNPLKEIEDSKLLAKHLNSLSTAARFLRFARDFRKDFKDGIEQRLVHIAGKHYFKLKLRDAAEYLLTKDYTDNWKSEMNERFCHWSFSDWKLHLESAGFRLHKASGSFQNPWIVSNRMENKCKILDAKDLSPLPFPPTNILVVATKRV